MNKKEVEQKYNKLLQEVATDDYYKIDLTNRVNCYTCTCGHITKTIDIDAGVTPMFFSCESCDSRATSKGYRDIAPGQKPTIEWYRPTLEHVLQNLHNSDIVGHILNGGLEFRRIIFPFNDELTPVMDNAAQPELKPLRLSKNEIRNLQRRGWIILPAAFMYPQLVGTPDFNGSARVKVMKEHFKNLW